MSLTFSQHGNTFGRGSMVFKCPTLIQARCLHEQRTSVPVPLNIACMTCEKDCLIFFFFLNSSLSNKDWLGQNGSSSRSLLFGVGNTGGGSMASPYQAIKQAEMSLQLAAANHCLILPIAQKSAAFVGFGKDDSRLSIYDTGLTCLPKWNPNGCRRVLNPGPFVPYTSADKSR